MKKSISEITSELRQLLDEDEDVILLRKLEKKMENDENAMALSYRYSVAQDEYNDALKHYQEDSNEVKKAQHKLYLQKKELDESPVVREYLMQYQKVRLIYDKIDNVLFSHFKEETCEKKTND